MRRTKKAPSPRNIADIERERAAAGLCRHCGGRVPCYSPFGDQSPGRRHNRASWKGEGGLITPWRRP